MAGVLLFARVSISNYMASKVPSVLDTVAETVGYRVGIKLGYCALTAIRTTPKTISSPGAKTRSVPFAAPPF